MTTKAEDERDSYLARVAVPDKAILSRLDRAVAKGPTEQDEAIAKLREWIKPGDTVYTVLDAVSRSGMSRQIRVVLLTTNEQGQCDTLHPNWAVGKALGLRHAKRNGYEQDALVIGGAGMDMGFHLVYELSYALYGKGYDCLGAKANCPSNAHQGPNRDKTYGAQVRHTDGYALRHRWL